MRVWQITLWDDLFHELNAVIKYCHEQCKKSFHISNRKTSFVFKGINSRSRLLTFSVPLWSSKCMKADLNNFFSRIPLLIYNCRVTYTIHAFLHRHDLILLHFGWVRVHLASNHRRNMCREMNESPKSNALFRWCCCCFVLWNAHGVWVTHFIPLLKWKMRINDHRRERNIPMDRQASAVCVRACIRFPMPLMESWIYSSVKQQSVRTYY